MGASVRVVGREVGRGIVLLQPRGGPGLTRRDVALLEVVEGEAGEYALRRLSGRGRSAVASTPQ